MYVESKLDSLWANANHYAWEMQLFSITVYAVFHLYVMLDFNHLYCLLMIS